MNAQNALQLRENLGIVEEAWINCVNKRKSHEFLKLHSEEVIMYDPTLPEPLRGRKALDSWFMGLFKMFPDYQVEKERIFAQEDWVCLESIESGTLKGAIIGPSGQTVPPTDKAFRIRSCTVCNVQHGKIREVRVYYDVMTLLTQLGLQS